MTDPTETDVASEPIDAGAPGASGAVVEGPGRRRHTFADLYHERTNFQFIAHSRRWAIVSGVLIAVSLVSLIFQGLNLGIDFEGGTAWQVPVPGSKPSIDDVRSVLDDLGIGEAKVSILDPSGQDDAYQIRVQSELLDDPVSEVRALVATAADVPRAEVVYAQQADGSATWTAQASVSVDADALSVDVDEALGVDDVTTVVEDSTVVVTAPSVPSSPVADVTERLAEFAGVDPGEVSVDTVGPTWGERVTRKAVQALVIFFVVVVLYLSFRFEWKMAIAAIVAVIHDIIVTAGFYSVFGFTVTPATVTAFLTILGFSLYDTVVVFDKVRENTEALRHVGRNTYSEMVNRSLNQVLMRSLSTSLVAVLPVASILVVGAWWLGATSLADFGLALLVGLVIGTYSSLFVATPLLAAWKEREPAYAAIRTKLAQQAARADARPAAAAPAAPAAAPTPGPIAPRPDAEAEQTALVAPRARQQRRRKRR